jgi:hypothetical protein
MLKLEITGMMFTRHVFKAVDSAPTRIKSWGYDNYKGDAPETAYPVKGDLIRSTRTGDYINLVLEVSHETLDGTRRFKYIRSVRYGYTNRGKFELLHGTRSRSIRWFSNELGWEIVREFVEFDNRKLIKEILESLEGVNTAYEKRDESSGDDDIHA